MIVELSQECNQGPSYAISGEKYKASLSGVVRKGPAVWSGESARGGCYKEGQRANEAR